MLSGPRMFNATIMKAPVFVVIAKNKHTDLTGTISKLNGYTSPSKALLDAIERDRGFMCIGKNIVQMPTSKLNRFYPIFEATDKDLLSYAATQVKFDPHARIIEVIGNDNKIRWKATPAGVLQGYAIVSYDAIHEVVTHPEKVHRLGIYTFKVPAKAIMNHNLPAIPLGCYKASLKEFEYTLSLRDSF